MKTELEELRDEVAALRAEVAQLRAGGVHHHYHYGQPTLLPPQQPTLPTVYPYVGSPGLSTSVMGRAIDHVGTFCVNDGANPPLRG